MRAVVPVILQHWWEGGFPTFSDMMLEVIGSVRTGFDGGLVLKGPFQPSLWALFLYLLATKALKEELILGSQDQAHGSGSQVLLSHFRGSRG